MRLGEASSRQLQRWDSEIDSSVNGTLFHLLSFLAYHGERFEGLEHHLVLLDGEAEIGHISLTIRDADTTGEPRERVARSPYGGSFGGFAFRAFPTYSQSRDAVNALTEYLTESGVDRFVLTLPPACCATQSLDTFSFALLEAGFQSVCRDICSVVALEGSGPIRAAVTSRARNSAAKAAKAGVEVVRDADIEQLWTVMRAGYEGKGRRPTHSKDELGWLSSKLPKRVRLAVATYEGIPVAGLASFVINSRVDSSFYLSQDPVYGQLQALSLLVLDHLERSQEEGFSWFDFGTSTAEMVGNASLFRFKESFGRVGMFRETFQWARS